MPRRACLWLLAALPFLAGCGHFTHKGPDDCVLRPADTVPEESKSSVYVFLFDTYNPLHSGGLFGVRDHLHELGFGKTFYGYPHHSEKFLADLQMVSAERPNARFAVIGYGLGAAAASRFAAAASESGVTVDLLIYLEPSAIEPWDDPDAAFNTITVRADHLNSPCDHHSVKESAVPTHPDVLALIEQELTLIAMGIPPPPRKKPQRVVLVPPMPAPREAIPIPKELPPEWQFLRPRHPWEVPPPVRVYGNETLPFPRVVDELPPPREVK